MEMLGQNDYTGLTNDTRITDLFSHHYTQPRSGRASNPSDQMPSSASQISAQDMTTKPKGSQKSIILAVVLTVLILLVLALIGVVIFLVLRDTDNCEGTTPAGPIPPTANPKITVSPFTLVVPDPGMYSNIELTHLFRKEQEVIKHVEN